MSAEGEQPCVTQSFWNKNQTAVTSPVSRHWQDVSARAPAAPKHLPISARQLSFTSKTAATLAILSQLRSVRNSSKSKPHSRKDAVRGHASHCSFRPRSEGRPGTGRLRIPPPEGQPHVILRRDE